MFSITIWFLSAFIIFWAMIGYPISLKILSKIIKRRPTHLDGYEPTVTVMVVAHDEEKVIKEKLDNIVSVDYPIEKLDILVTSDHSTDCTNQIVKDYIECHKNRKIQLYVTKEHRGKTNAQNEAQKLVESEILVLTDANSIFEKDAIRQLVSCFYDESVAYVTGRLCYINDSCNMTANSEGFYWRLDLMERKMESDIQTITAGNGAIYACRNRLYKVIDPIKCHDLIWPLQYALDKKRALYNPRAIAYEKAGESDEDEFKRKVRMNRTILKDILPDLKILNIFKYKWFTYFYLGHRTFRYLLWIAHIFLLASNIIIAFKYKWAKIMLGLQSLFYIIALAGKIRKNPNKLERISWYYLMTMIAQLCGAKNMLLGKTKPTWDKAETTR
jgi:cellulose synthase/poly-beta-1,6-N-acetylglucosamine synthase-like glycosyltransferase